MRRKNAVRYCTYETNGRTTFLPLERYIKGQNSEEILSRKWDVLGSSEYHINLRRNVPEGVALPGKSALRTRDMCLIEGPQIKVILTHGKSPCLYCHSILLFTSIQNIQRAQYQKSVAIHVYSRLYSTESWLTVMTVSLSRKSLHKYIS